MKCLALYNISAKANSYYNEKKNEKKPPPNKQKKGEKFSDRTQRGSVVMMFSGDDVLW